MPEPLRPADAREVRYHKSLGGVFADGAAFLAATDISIVVPVAGEARWRVRFKASQAGTLKAAYLRTDGTTAYTTGNPADVTIAANVENKIEDATVYGESLLKITFTPGATPGTVTYADISHF